MKPLPRVAAAIVALVVVAGPASAADPSFPDHPVRLVVPFSPGGPSDILARQLGVRLTDIWGQSVVVDNRAGASGQIGTELVVRAPPDGYTLVLSNAADAISVGLYPKLPYDVTKDLRPVCLVSISPFILVVHPSVPVKSLSELIAYAKAHPGELGFASGGGVGVPSHMAGEMLKWRAGIDLLHVPYKGQGPATSDVLSGHVPLMFANPMNGLPFIRDGRLRALGVSTPKRLEVAPDIPTLAEQGLPGFDVGIWFAVQAPAATPDDIVAKIAGTFRTVLEQPDVRAQQAAQGADAVFEEPDAVAHRIRVDIDKWREVIKAADLHPE